MLRILGKDNPNDWVYWLADAKFTINIAPSATTGMAPFEACNGWLPAAWPQDAITTSDMPSADAAVTRTQLAWRKVTNAQIGAQI